MNAYSTALLPYVTNSIGLRKSGPILIDSFLGSWNVRAIAEGYVLLSEPGQQGEVDAIKLSLYLNMAQCYIKLEQWENARKNCDEALLLLSADVKKGAW